MTTGTSHTTDGVATKGRGGDKTCFVVMPIGGESSEDHSELRALYEEIRDTVQQRGYSVVRADDVAKPGAITKDIILRLAESDIVIADLSGLNPNVFYELGVRHSLRGRGTLMILDKSRTAAIPFDLQTYRAIIFKGDLLGIQKLRTELKRFLDGLANDDASAGGDSPVHDFIPSLPANAIESATSSQEGKLLAQLADARRQLKAYQSGQKNSVPATSVALPPIQVVEVALREANDGRLPSDLLESAERAAASRDQKSFLAAVHGALSITALRLEPAALRRLALASANLGLRDVAGAIYDHARNLYPKDSRTTRAHLGFLSHSTDPSDRERARNEILNLLGIATVAGKADMPEHYTEDFEGLFGVLLDGLGEDGLHTEVLTLTEAAIARFPGRSMVVRNHGRAISRVRGSEAALEFFQRAIRCADADDTAAWWLGNALHEAESYVDAAEVYALACVLDPNDANTFANVAEEIGFAIRKKERNEALDVPNSGRVLPESVAERAIEEACAAALSCPMLRQSDIERCARTVESFHLDVQISGAHNLPPQQRRQLAKELYEKLRSPLTHRAAGRPDAGPAATAQAG